MDKQLKIIISAEIDKLKKGVEDAKKQVKTFKEQVKDASKNVDDNFKKMGEGIKSGLKVVGATIAAAGAALLALGASTEEYRQNQAKLNTAFEQAGASAGAAKDTYNDLYRVLGDGGQATEAAAHLAKLTNEEKALNEWTTICQGVYATFGDSLPIEGLTEAANETAKVGTVTGSLADALNWAGISEDAFNEKLAKCNSESEREKLIRETLNGVYDEAAASYEKSNAQILAQHEAQAKLQETTALLGEAVAPVVTAFTSFANDALAVVVPYVQQLAEQYMPVLQETLNGVATALEAAFTWASQHKELLMVVGGLILTIVTAIGLYNAVAVVKAAMTAMEVTTVGALASAYLAQAAAMIVAIAPYALIVAAIAGVIAIIVVVIKHWKNHSKEIKATWKETKEATKEAVDKVVGFFKDLVSKAKEKVNQLKEAVVNKFNDIKSGITEKVQAAKEAAVNKFEEIKSGIKGKIDTVKSNVTSTFNAVKEAITKPVETAKEKVKSAIDKMKDFFKFKWSLPKLAMPHITIKGKFSLSPLSVPKFDIDWYQHGGVFDKATLFNYAGGIGGLGENGAEAVVPLEKNTQWLDRIADKLAAKQNGIPIVLQVDGKTFAQVSIDSINALTKQRGTLGLNLV